MKKRFFVGTIFSVAMAGICASAEATTRPSVMILKEPPHRVYHVVKEQGLRAAAQQIAERSGIKFKISADIGSDQVSKKLAADNWDEALFQFLAGYNYTLTTEKGSIKSVIITGKNGSGSQNKAKQELESQMLAVVPGQQSLPAVYSQLAPGSVMPIALSMSKIAAVKLGSKVVLDLPVGQYTINHDEKVDDGNGAMTWMGYLDDEGKGYRLYLSQGEAGIMGNLNTPDGSYQIETVDGQTYLVDEVRSGMSLGGYHNDEALLSAMPAFNVVEPELRTAAARVSSGRVG